MSALTPEQTAADLAAAHAHTGASTIDLDEGVPFDIYG